MIIKQPDGKYARWSQGIDGFTHTDMTAIEVEEFFVKRAVEIARADVARMLADADERGCSAPLPFAMDWDEAVAKHNERWPEDHVDP